MPLRTALDRAIRDELLVREAARRGIAGDARASQLAALIAQERRATPGMVPEEISDQDAQSWFDGNRALFEDVAAAHVDWAEVDDAGRAQQLFDRSDNGDRATFSAVTRNDPAVIDSGTASIDHNGAGADEMVARVAFAVRRARGVGLGQNGDDGHWWLVRVAQISFEALTWDATLSARVRTSMAWQREQDHFRALTDELRHRWPVHVYESRLAGLVD